MKLMVLAVALSLPLAILGQSVNRLVNGATGGGVSSIAQFAPFYGGGGVTFGFCSTVSPCYLAPNNQLNTYTSAPAVIPAAGTAADTLFIYGVPGSNTIQVGKGSTNTYGCSGCQVISGISAAPSNSYAMYKCIVTGGQVVSGGCTAVSTPYSNTSFENGLGTLPLIDTATGALQINNNRKPRIVTSGSDTITNLDCGGMVIYSETSTVNVALPQAGIGNPVTFASGCDIWLVNIGAGSVQITPNSSSPINGSTSTQTLTAGSASAPTGMYVVSNGLKYYAVPASRGGAVVPLTLSSSAQQLTLADPSNLRAAVFVGPIWSINANGSAASNQKFYIKNGTGASDLLIDPTNDLVTIPNLSASNVVAGPAFQVTTSSSAPGSCTASADIGRFWINTSDSNNTHLNVCAVVSGITGWKQVF